MAWLISQIEELQSGHRQGNKHILISYLYAHTSAVHASKGGIDSLLYTYYELLLIFIIIIILGVHMCLYIASACPVGANFLSGTYT